MSDAAPCERCQTFSGLYWKQNRCCTVRMLANSPKPHRVAAMNKVRAEQGIEAAEKLKADIAAEYHRRIAYMAARKSQ
ncbi:hypothetical protein LA345_38805 (plasmid) [Burkholderia vietnamiensis]|nr:hypothetical protein [Burkholderia vietnamiensis]